MDLVARNRKLFHQIEEKLSCFLKSLREKPENAGPDLHAVVEKAAEVGGKLLQDVEALQKDFLHFLKKPSDQKISSKMRDDALRIKHELREL